MSHLVYFFFLIFSTYASAQLCDQCDTSKATFFAYSKALESGACGYGDLGPKLYGHVAAARDIIYRDGQGCGACYQVRCENKALCTKMGTRIVVTDIYNHKDNTTDFKLSSRAFRAMALPGKDKQLMKLRNVDIEYKRIPCDYKGKNVTIKVEKYSKNPNYLAINILYQGGQTRIGGVQVASDDPSSYLMDMDHKYGAVYETRSAPKGALMFRFFVYGGFDVQHFYTNHVLPANWIPGNLYSSTEQMDVIAIENCKTCKGF